MYFVHATRNGTRLVEIQLFYLRLPMFFKTERTLSLGTPPERENLIAAIYGVFYHLAVRQVRHEQLIVLVKRTGPAILYYAAERQQETSADRLAFVIRTEYCSLTVFPAIQQGGKKPLWRHQ